MHNADRLRCNIRWRFSISIINKLCFRNWYILFDFGVWIMPWATIFTRHLSATILLQHFRSTKSFERISPLCRTLNCNTSYISRSCILCILNKCEFCSIWIRFPSGNMSLAAADQPQGKRTVASVQIEQCQLPKPYNRKLFTFIPKCTPINWKLWKFDWIWIVNQCWVTIRWRKNEVTNGKVKANDYDIYYTDNGYLMAKSCLRIFLLCTIFCL